MDRDTIIRLAQEAGLWEVLDLFSGEFGNANTEEDCLPDLTRFAALVAAHEREACIKVCEQLEQEWEDAELWASFKAVGFVIDAIRSRT